jgi:hypothetical protein
MALGVEEAQVVKNIVFMATIPWRKPACQQMLQSLERQTIKPDEVLLHLDGFTAEDDPPWVPPSLNVKLIRLKGHQGIGARWRSLTEEHKGTMIFGMDDDFLYSSRYIADTLSAQEQFGGGISWHGLAATRERMWWMREPAESAPLSWMGTGFLCVPGEHLVGIDKHELASKFFAIKGHEEALVSFWLWQRKVIVTRPSGKTPVDGKHKLGSDPRSTSIALRKRKKALRRILYEKYGWPGGRS